MSRITHQYCAGSLFNTLLRYWEMFCILYTLLSSTSINLNEDSTIMLELCKLLNFKLARTSDYLYPGKEFFTEMKQHCLQTLLRIINQEDDEGSIISKPKLATFSPRNNNFKAFIMPHNNGRLVAAILKRRVWWKILRNQSDYDFIWTPLLRKGIFQIFVYLYLYLDLDLIEQLPTPILLAQ